MEAKITKAQVDTELLAANMQGEGASNPARALRAKETLLRWAKLPPDSFEHDYLLNACRGAVGFF